MKDETENNIPKPCISICEEDIATGFCRGCLRTGQERMLWKQAKADGNLALQRNILEEIRQRYQSHHELPQFSPAKNNPVFLKTYKYSS